LRDASYLVDLLGQVTGISRAKVIERLREEETNPGRTVRKELESLGIEPYVWSDELVRFYTQTDAFLFESLVWNVTRHKNQMRRWIAGFLLREFRRCVRILVYGDGLGFDSYYLAQAGHQVSSFEVSRNGVRFATSIFASGDVDVQIFDDDELPADHFDALVCLDVLEHVPNPPQLVKQLTSLLSPGGLMIVHAPFFFVDPAVSTHLRANRKYSGDVRRLYRPAGLRPVEGRPFWDPIVLQKTNGGHQTQARRQPWLLRTMGLLLAIGRYWSKPHSVIARRMTRIRQTSLTDQV